MVAAGLAVPWRFLPFTLAAGLTMAVAAGMFFTGLGVDPVVSGAAQLHPWLASPLLGPVPVPAGRDDRQETAAGWSIGVLNAWAAILVLVCLLALAVAFR
jgi:hypothetical protein